MPMTKCNKENEGLNMKTDKISMADCAYNYLLKKKKAKSFYDIWNNVIEELEITNPEEIISFFYTNLTLDSRFVNVGENKWDLRERLPFEKVHIDMNDIYTEEEETFDEEYDDEVEVLSSEEDYDSYEEKETLEAAKFGFQIDSDEDEEN